MSWRARAFSAVLLAALATACGGSTRGPAAPADAAPEASASTDAGSDAPVYVDQDPNVYPARHHSPPLAQNRGGAVLFSPKVATVTFTSDTNAQAIATFGEALVGSDYAKQVLTPFNIFPPASLGTFTLANPFGARTIDDVTVFQPWIQQQVQSGLLPHADNDTLYVFYLPPGLNATDRSGVTTCSGSGGYHDATSVQAAGGSILVAYAVVAQCPTTTMTGLTFAASHEIVEAMTDAHPENDPAFYIATNVAWTGPGGAEVADICQGLGSLTLGSYALARIWSDDTVTSGADPCQPAPAGRIYFQAAVDTEVQTTTDSLGIYTSDGFVTIARGASKDAHAVVFSEAALPNDVSLVVGIPGMAGSDPSMVGPIAPGVTASLSRTTAHNGNAVTISLSADASAAPGDYPFVVRSILTSTDFHSWPVILRVR